MEIITIPILCGELPKFLGAISYEGDKNVRRLEFTGAETDLQYKLDMERLSDGMKNVVDLENRGGTLVLDMDGNVRIPAGRYHVQLRTVGETVLHSNKAFLTVRESIDAIDAFPAEVPAEMRQMEQRMTELAAHPPVPGENGFWMLWDRDTDAYAESQMPMQVNPIFVAEYAKTSLKELKNAWDNGCLLWCHKEEFLFPLYKIESNMVTFRLNSQTSALCCWCKESGWGSEATKHPQSHAANHKKGGSDALKPEDIGAVSDGNLVKKGVALFTVNGKPYAAIGGATWQDFVQSGGNGKIEGSDCKWFNWTKQYPTYAATYFPEDEYAEYMNLQRQVKGQSVNVSLTEQILAGEAYYTED